MSYSIIFETVICKVDNDKILHLSRQGCNNDTEGRIKSEFIGKLYSVEDWKNKIKKLEAGNSEGFELKIGSICCAIADYGKHLRTITKRAVMFDDFVKDNVLCLKNFVGCNIVYNDGTEKFVQGEIDTLALFRTEENIAYIRPQIEEIKEPNKIISYLNKADYGNFYLRMK